MNDLSFRSRRALAIAEFEIWLPEEAEYSVRKAGFDEKIRRAQMPPDEAASMRGFLGRQWSIFRYARAGGNLYQPFHGKSAQSMLVKLAAGLFDKAALGSWLLSGDPATEEAFVEHAVTQAQKIADRTYEHRVLVQQNVRPLLDVEIEGTPFDAGITQIMRLICNAVDTINSPHDFIRSGAEEDVQRFMMQASLLGEIATQCYGEFAAQDLTLEQMMAIPRSELAN